MVRYSEFNEDNNEDKIRSLLSEYFRIRGRSSIENGLVDIDGGIALIKSCELLPVKFGKISNTFDCSSSQLTSLVGSPSHVGDSFYCFSNQLTSLVGSPSHIGGSFNCSDNQLISLTGSPSHIGGGFSCSYNQLTSLTGSPSHIGGGFSCSYNQLTSLIGSPAYIGSDFYCNHNQLTSLTGSPSHISNDFYCFNNPLISLEGIPDNIEGDIHIDWNKDLPLLRLLKYKHVKVKEHALVGQIIKKYCELGFSRSNLIQCQRELIDSGYESNARW